MNPPKQFTARLSEKQVLNGKFTQFYFELNEPNRMAFDAGQYVSIAVDDKGTRRSYSISSTPVKDHGFELLVDMAPNGAGVQFLNALPFGGEARILGPLGMFIISPALQQSPIVLVATGSGVAPFKSMILDLLQQKNFTQPLILYWGLRHVEDLFWQDEFQHIANSFPNFKFHPVISQAADEWPLCRGRVTDCLYVHDLPENGHYFLCGNTKMIEDVITLLQNRGVSKENIHREKFY